MPSLADIPDDLLDADKAQEFTDWLSHLPIDYPTRRALAYTWMAATDTHLTSTQWQQITPPRP